MMTKTQARKVGKKIKDKTCGPIPQYSDWEDAEALAVDHCMMNIKFLNGMEDLTLNFGHGYQRAVRVIDFHRPIYLIDTDRGTIRVQVEDMAIQKKSWWERHFNGNRNAEIIVAYRLKGTRDLDGEHFELNRWTANANISNVAELIESIAYQERDLAETIYRQGGVEFE